MSRGELTSSEVKKKFKGFRYPDMVTNDVFSLYKNFKSLKPQDQQSFVHPNGSKESCVSVNGTIPVKIRGQQYNIPISIWVRPAHPYISPIVYVRPTADMGISQSQYVDTNGMVYLPYISEWKQGLSDLSTLVQIMCATFAEKCPVYSKAHRPTYPTNPPHPQPPSQTNYHSPYPQNVPYSQPQPPAAYGNQPYPAVSTPYPAGPPVMPTPTPQSNYQPPPATGGTPYYAGGNTPYPTSTAYHPQPTPPHHVPTSSHPPHPTHANPYLPHQQVPTSTIATTAVAATAAASATISAEEERKQIEENERIKRNSLESAVEDRIRRQVKQVLDAAQAEMETMLKNQVELKNGSKKINSMLEEMDSKKHEVNESIELLQSKNAELESMLDYLRAQPDKIDVDDAITATNPLYKQILQLYAEENAIDDTIYYLGEALRKGVIQLDVFLKHVRELSRQQFMARATIMKARSAAQLPDYGTA